MMKLNGILKSKVITIATKSPHFQQKCFPTLPENLNKEKLIAFN